MQHLGIVDDIVPVECKGAGGELVEGKLPFGQQNAGESPLGVEGIGTGKRVETRCDHQLEIAFGENYVGILPVEDFALFGDANLALEGADRLGVNGAMCRAAAASDRAAAAVKEAQMHAAFARHLMQGAVGAEDLPCAGQHAAVFIRIGVAEHDLLAPAP